MAFFTTPQNHETINGLAEVAGPRGPWATVFETLSQKAMTDIKTTDDTDPMALGQHQKGVCMWTEAPDCPQGAFTPTFPVSQLCEGDGGHDKH